MGLACISTDFNSGAAVELSGNGERALLIKVGAQDELICALQMLIDNENLKERLMQKAPIIRDVLLKEQLVNNWLNYACKVISK